MSTNPTIQMILGTYKVVYMVFFCGGRRGLMVMAWIAAQEVVSSNPAVSKISVLTGQISLSILTGQTSSKVIIAHWQVTLAGRVVYQQSCILITV